MSFDETHAEGMTPATLNGRSCLAKAWVNVTHVDVLDGKGGTLRVEGIRKWRGRALLDDVSIAEALPYDAPIRFSGTVVCGEEERHIEADVYLNYSKRHLATIPSGDGAPVRPQTYVEFIGAEGPFKTAKKSEA